jgi:acetyl-CoA carboxylase carboxyl transferase subunit alpha
LKLTAPDLLEFGLIDSIVPEPKGGAHVDHKEAAELLSKALGESLRTLRGISDGELVNRRYQKFRRMGEFEDREAQGRSQTSN